MDRLEREVLTAVEIARIGQLTPSDLYQEWWSGDTSVAFAEESSISWMSEDEFPIVEIGVSGVIVSTLLGRKFIPNGEWVLLNETRVRVHRRQSWTDRYFTWYQGLGLAPSEKYPLLRVYVPSEGEQSDRTFRSLCRELDASLAPFVAKFRRGSGNFHDQSIFYLHEGGSQLLLEVIKIETEILPPPLTAHIRGVGVAPETSDFNSLGMSICEGICRNLTNQVNGLSSWLPQNIQSDFLEEIHALETKWNS